ncbi:MAG: PEP-CTERM sorting domain-containing protein [Chthoniobacterales bacterium]
MIKKLVASVLGACALLACSTTVFGGSGIYDPFAIVNGAFYDLGAVTALPDYQGAFLGTFDPATQLLLLGGQEKSFKNNGTDVTGHFLGWRVYSGAPSGSFANIGYPFQWNSGDPGAPGNLGNVGDQQWGTDVEGANGTNAAVNILTGLAPGTYTLEVFSFINTNSVDAPAQIFNNNGGANYTATFTVVPEPSTLTLLAGPGLLGAWFFVRRRRAK